MEEGAGKGVRGWWKSTDKEQEQRGGRKRVGKNGKGDRRMFWENEVGEETEDGEGVGRKRTEVKKRRKGKVGKEEVETQVEEEEIEKEKEK